MVDGPTSETCGRTRRGRRRSFWASRPRFIAVKSPTLYGAHSCATSFLFPVTTKSLKGEKAQALRVVLQGTSSYDYDKQILSTSIKFLISTGEVEPACHMRCESVTVVEWDVEKMPDPLLGSV